MKRLYGMSLVEVLLGLVIGATLLLAVATAVHASSRSMTNNEQFFKATQAARLSLLNISTALRTADVAELGSTKPALDQPSPIQWPASSELKLGHLVNNPMTGTQEMRYSYYKLVSSTGASGELMLEREESSGPKRQYVLSRNVEDIAFTGQLHKRAYVFCDICNVQMDQKEPETPSDPEFVCPRNSAHFSGPVWDLANVQIQMTVQLGTNAVVMSNSVVPRKVMVVR